MSTYLETRIQRLELETLDARRTIRQLLGRLADVEQAGRVAQSGPAPGGGDGGGSKTRLCRTTTAVTASTATVPGSGTVQPITYDPDEEEYADVGDPVDALNAGGAISSGKRGVLIQDAAGAFWVSPEECES